MTGVRAYKARAAGGNTDALVLKHAELVKRIAYHLAGRLPASFVCGPTPLVEAVASALVRLGHAPPTIKTERFGPTGG